MHENVTNPCCASLSSQLVGFALLLAGTFTYYAVIHFPCFKYEMHINVPVEASAAPSSVAAVSPAGGDVEAPLSAPPHKQTFMEKLHIHLRFPFTHFLPSLRH